MWFRVNVVLCAYLLRCCGGAVVLAVDTAVDTAIDIATHARASFVWRMSCFL